MPQSLSKILVHIVFSTKDREPRIEPSFERELHAYLATVARSCDSPVLQIGGMRDHVHLLVGLGRRTCIADLVKQLKQSSSVWLKSHGRFYWQRGYGAFSIGESNAAACKRYIREQRAHHTKMTYQEELRELLRRYRVEFDERYVWD